MEFLICALCWALVYVYGIAALTGVTMGISLIVIARHGAKWKKEHPSVEGEAEPLYLYMRRVAVIWVYCMIWGYYALGSWTKHYNRRPELDTSEPLLVVCPHPETLAMSKLAQVCHLDIAIPMAAAAKRGYQSSSMGDAAENTDTFVFIDQDGGRESAKDGATRAMRIFIPGNALVILPEGHRPTPGRVQRSIERCSEYADHLKESQSWRPGLIQTVVDKYNCPVKAVVFYPVLGRRIWERSWWDLLLKIPLLVGNRLHVKWEPELVEFRPFDIEGTKATLLQLSKNYEAFIGEVRKRHKRRWWRLS